MQAAKKRGKVLGNPDIGEVAKRGRAVAKANARRFPPRAEDNVYDDVYRVFRARYSCANRADREARRG